jgi:hypothetical protein
MFNESGYAQKLFLTYPTHQFDGVSCGDNLEPSGTSGASGHPAKIGKPFGAWQE